MGCNLEPEVEANILNFKNNLNESNIYKNKKDPNFPDMEEWPGEKYKGYGIKRMKGYKCDLPIDKLNELREKFWSIKTKENPKWYIIHQICVFDEERANITLGHYNFEVAENCINHIIDNNGEHYYVSNYCINDPYFEKVLNNKDTEEKNVKLFLYDVSTDITIEEIFSNHDNGEKIKKKFIDETKLNTNEYKIKLFFSGMEIKDNDFIYQHRMDNNYKIQIMKIKI